MDAAQFRSVFRNWPRWAVEAAVAALMVILTFGLRLLIHQVATDVVPFALVFPAVAGATLLASWRAGLAVLIVCQLTVWYLFLPIFRSFTFASPGNVISPVLATLAQLVMLWAMSRYASIQKQAAEAEATRAAEAADRAAQLQVALRELDHRTMNNFQLAAAVLSSHQGRESSPDVQAALHSAAQKLVVLASVHRKLRWDTGDLTRRPLAPLLEEVVDALRGHVVGDGVRISTDLQPVDVPHEQALHLALIVNELVTNALKHAFPTAEGMVQVSTTVSDDRIFLRVADNGVGSDPCDQQGSGSRLLDALARGLGATLTRADGAGTTVTISVPRD